MRKSPRLIVALAALTFCFSPARGQQIDPLIGIWLTKVATLTGIDAQAWVWLRGDGTFDRMILTPQYGQAPAACQIATGTWRSPPGGEARTVTYMITDYQPKLCLTAPVAGNPVVCEPPPPEFQHETTISLTFEGRDALTQADPSGMFARYMREPMMPPDSPYCHDQRQQ